MNIQQLFNDQISNITVSQEKKNAIKKIILKSNWSVFNFENKKFYFVEKPNEGFNEESNDLIVNKIKIFLKKYPLIFSIIFRSAGLSFLGKSSKNAINSIPKGDLIINLGSGPTSVREDIINIDFYPFKNVDVIADIANLPFEDNIADGVICEHVLEHVEDPEKVISEIYRVLKPGGIVYIVIPFVMSFHSSPRDFYRWSKMGLEQQLNSFEKVESGIRSGPGAALEYILAEYLGTLFSFGSKKIQQILFILFFILFAPLCWLDYLIYRFPTSENIAQHFYYIGKKK